MKHFFLICILAFSLNPIFALAQNYEIGQSRDAWYAQCLEARDGNSEAEQLCAEEWNRIESGINNVNSGGDISVGDCDISTLSIRGLLGCITRGIVVPLINLLVSLAILVFLWGLVKYIYKADNDTERTKGKNLMFFGIIGLFVMVSMWGLVGILTGVFFGSSSPANLNPPIPQLPAGIIQ